MEHIMEHTIEDQKVHHIISEPGDMTRYDFYLISNYDEYLFYSFENSFAYPQKLDYWLVKDLSDEEISKLSEELNVNPHTLKQCILAIKQVRTKNCEV